MRVAGVLAAVILVVVAVFTTSLTVALQPAGHGNGTGTGRCGQSATSIAASQSDSVSELNQVQKQRAASIITTGQRKGIPRRGWVIAIAVAMQESSLRNLANDNPAYPRVRAISLSLPHDGIGRDHDSVGLFQQRPVEGDGSWGTVTELMTPDIAADKFYAALTMVSDWPSRPLAMVAQQVQRSGFPDAYAKWETFAETIVAAISGSAASCGTRVVSAAGWTAPITAPLVSGFRTSDRPDHDGVDLSGPRGTTVRAAAAGTVITVLCNASTGNCDIDGSPFVRGCGWYLEIHHQDGILTRYCHLQQRPTVSVGQKVAAGQPIGQEGSSGNSSGPHLHFEVHLNNDTSSAGAIDPVPFMAQRGAPLGIPSN